MWSDLKKLGEGRSDAKSLDPRLTAGRFVLQNGRIHPLRIDRTSAPFRSENITANPQRLALSLWYTWGMISLGEIFIIFGALSSAGTVPVKFLWLSTAMVVIYKM
ncbi:uncharacterized protein A1O5_09247 [Cladophialophora psammophila CBS 110553]|uniref:Uncharacterized protein n=1 Tax=Cladophialophora psammophila CBS 110553 TaxID=1182543 RepID=W9WSD3_9EURO|nr:uncharacterized protein A1O5_09247 [Cladophialophora psammophila CBS 110553]EXJ67900.1 hypothetical protein A1O5_09247 [Cladophialophora psammophila CBS 110553]